MYETGITVAKLWPKNHKESILHILKPSYMSYKFNNINLQNLYEEGGNVIW